MSTQTDARHPKDSDEWRPRSATKRSRKRPFLIEYRWKMWKGPWSQWKKWQGYETKARRDMAFMCKQNPGGYHQMEFRKCDKSP